MTDISYLDPNEGIRFRGKTIPETFAALPKVPDTEYPYVEGFWYFLMTGDVPTNEEALAVVADFKARATVPKYVFDVLRAMPRDSHPLVLLIIPMATAPMLLRGSDATGEGDAKRRGAPDHTPQRRRQHPHLRGQPVEFNRLGGALQEIVARLLQLSGVFPRRPPSRTGS